MDVDTVVVAVIALGFWALVIRWAAPRIRTRDDD
jgi:hypothetical protein